MVDTQRSYISLRQLLFQYLVLVIPQSTAYMFRKHYISVNFVLHVFFSSPLLQTLRGVLLSPFPNKLVKPAEDLVVPLEAVPMVEHPVVLIRENDKATRNALPK